MKFRSKLVIGFGTVLALMLLLAYTGLLFFQQLNSTLNRIVDESYAAVKLASSIRGEINSINREITAYMLDRDTAGNKSHMESIAESRQRILGDWNRLSGLESKPSDSEALVQIGKLYGEFNNGVDRLIRLTEDGRGDEALEYYHSALETSRASLFDSIRAFSVMYDREIEQELAASDDSYSDMLLLLAGLVAILLATSIAVAVWVFRGVTASLRRVATVMEGISGGDTDRLPRIKVEAEDEIGHIAGAYNRLADKLEKHTRDVRVYQAMLEDRNWRMTKVAEFSAMFQNVNDERTLADTFLREIAPVTGAGSGAIYVCVNEEGTFSRMDKLASYADSGDDVGDAKIEPEQGLVGQCAKQNKTILLENIPSTHLRIRSGLGISQPSSLLLLPIPFDGKAIAVIELASHGLFDRSRVGLFEEICGLFGVALNSAFAYRRVRDLLSESQMYAEELQAQSEELQMQQEELRTLNEQLEEQYNKTDGKNKELETIREALEEKNRQVVLSSVYKSEFLANVSHELRTPLNSLLLLAQLLADNKQGNLLPKQLEYLRTIHASGAELLRLINEILDLSKIESGKVEILEDSVAVSDLAEEINNRFMPFAMQKRLVLRIQIREEVAHALLRTDVQKLQQILNNLLFNAIKFTEQGSVTVTFQRSSEEYRDGAERREFREYLVVSVTDTGIGIPREKQDMIFEAFRQADGTTSRKYGGTGLGLSISKELASLLGGTIGLVSEEGKGSTFILRIPLKESSMYKPNDVQAYAESAAASEPFPTLSGQAGADASQDKADDVKKLENRTVLLVDDDMRNIFALTGVLESFGMNVIFAENGREGLKMLERYPDTDLVLMDIMMPQMDGYEAIKAIRQSDEKYRGLPIIALTAKAMKDDRDKCLEAGANDYISKPVRYEQLLSLLRVWLHR